MTCRDVTDGLADYLAEELPTDQYAAFAAHFGACSKCAAYLKSYAETIALTKGASDRRDDLGEQMPEDLVQAILAARVKGRIV